MIVITTPTGDIGGRVLRHVIDAGAKVRLIVRDPARLPKKMRQDVEIIEGSHSDKATIDRALQGAQRVFWLPPGSPVSPTSDEAYIGFSRNFCEALPSSSITHVVGVSALGRGWPEPSGLVASSLKMDDMIGRTGVNYRALSCASLTDNIMRQSEMIRSSGVFYLPTPGDLKLPHVTKSDVAAIAAHLLLSPDWNGTAEVPLYGPEEISANKMAAIMSQTLGRPIQFREMSMEQFEHMLRNTGTSDGMAEAYIQMFIAKNAGMDTIDHPVTRDLTPTTFRQWCLDELCPAILGELEEKGHFDPKP